MSKVELSARWDGYLSKLKDRYYEILNSTEEPLNEVYNNMQYDNVIIHNITNGLKGQTVVQLSQKADDGWNKMQGEIYKNGFLFLIKEEGYKLAAFKKWLDVEFTRFQTKVFANAARKILENVKQHIDEKKMHRCTQCAAELPINIYSFMAVNIKCESCGAVNTYQPDDRVRALEYYVIEPLAEEYAIEEKIKGATDKSAMKEYYKKYYGYLMDNVPDKKESYQRTMDERLNNPFFSM